MEFEENLKNMSYQEYKDKFKKMTKVERAWFRTYTDFYDKMQDQELQTLFKEIREQVQKRLAKIKAL